MPVVPADPVATALHALGERDPLARWEQSAGDLAYLIATHRVGLVKGDVSLHFHCLEVVAERAFCKQARACFRHA